MPHADLSNLEKTVVDSFMLRRYGLCVAKAIISILLVSRPYIQHWKTEVNGRWLLIIDYANEPLQSVFI